MDAVLNPEQRWYANTNP